jgi:hypothetical protein
VLARIEDPLFGDISDFQREAQPWVVVDIPLPDARVLRFERRVAHPFFAEYDRRLRVGERVLNLPMNVGGLTYINVYYHSASSDRGPWVRLVDRLGEHIVDLTNPPTLGILCSREGATFYVRVAIDGGDRHGCGWVRTNYGPWEPMGDAAPVPFELPGRYLGVIDGRDPPLRFRPPSEVPEVVIKPL